MSRPPRIVAFTGSTRRPSKSRSLALALAARAEAQFGLSVEAYDVVDAGPGLGAAFSRSELSPEALRVVEAVEQADALIAITPVYKGSYSGLFKHLFDFVEPNALLNKPVVIGATGGGHRHALIVEHQLRPLFGFFSALIVPTSIYAADQEFIDGEIADAGVIGRVQSAVSQLAGLLGVREVAAPLEAVVPDALDTRIRVASVG